MKRFPKKDAGYRHRYMHYTSSRYFFSYFLILVFLLISFFLIIRNQLSKSYLDMLNQQAGQHLDNINVQLTDGLLTIDQLNHSLRYNHNLVSLRYNDTAWNQYRAFQQINSYAVANELIDCIVYTDKSHGITYSSGKYAEYQNGLLTLYNDVEQLSFPTKDYENSTTNQLILLRGDSTCSLVYYPGNDEESSFFYVLNQMKLKNIFKSILSAEIVSVALITPDGEIAVAINDSLLAPHISAVGSQPGIYHLDARTSLQICGGLYSGFTLAALISDDAMMAQINATFSQVYLILCLLGIAGLFLVCYSMKKTYQPLYRLTRKIVKNPKPDLSYLEQLDSAFSAASSENQDLLKKIDKYRLAMQQSILDAIVSGEPSNSARTFDNLDAFFTLEPDNLIFALHIKTAAQADSRDISAHPLPAQKIAHFFDKALPGKNSCLVLESSPNNATFLLCYTGTEQHKEEALLALLESFCNENEYLATLSNGSSSPMDIPSLYENALLASGAWNSTKVTAFGDVSESLSPSPALTYPYEELNRLAQDLKMQEFADAERKIDELFCLLDSPSTLESGLPVFFVRCVLIDILTAIINAMNQINMKFKDYNEIYFEALYLCRSCPYREKKEEIQNNIKQLLSQFRSEAESQIINAARIQQIVEENYTSIDFSIGCLADLFHVSIAYMSYLFKKEMGENFLDYVWELRLKKAKELLLGTDMPIDDISLAVGYANTSSFRRKFKQTTGLTPSQIRM